MASRPLTQIPFTVPRSAAGGFDIAHVFSATDAKAARSGGGGGPVVLTCWSRRREGLADRRHRLRMITDAFARSAPSGRRRRRQEVDREVARPETSRWSEPSDRDLSPLRSEIYRRV